jgi:hypothetical protein
VTEVEERKLRGTQRIWENQIFESPSVLYRMMMLIQVG